MREVVRRRAIAPNAAEARESARCKFASARTRIKGRSWAIGLQFWPLSSHPVLALFFGGFAISAATTKYGIHSYLVGWMLRLSGRRRAMLLLCVMAGTTLISMWVSSNIAAAAVMVVTLRPLLAQAQTEADASFPRALMLGR